MVQGEFESDAYTTLGIATLRQDPGSSVPKLMSFWTCVRSRTGVQGLGR